VDSTKNDRGAIESEKEQIDQVEVFREDKRGYPDSLVQTLSW